tara:strand:- start:846 stop:1475 length:630 start_codon:yes stop_codon:yes gene_type:complete
MNTDDWDIFYKYKQATKVRPNLVYVPRINKDKTIMCMDYNVDKRYFFDRPLYNNDIASYFFQNELQWIEHYKNESFIPEIIEVDKINKKIFFKWYNSSLNHIIFEKKFNNTLIQPIKDLLVKLEQTVYKINYYPHTMYLDGNNNIKMHDFYGCVSKANYYLPIDMIRPILGKMDIWRFGQYEKDGLVNMHEVYKMIFQVNSGEWPFGIK